MSAPSICASEQNPLLKVVRSSIFTKRGPSLFDRESIENRDYMLWVFIISWQQKQSAGFSTQINHQSCYGI